MSEGITQSQYYMWRTLFAVAHSDGIVTSEELTFMAHILEDIAFTEEQTVQLKEDIMEPKNVEDMFEGITSQDDRMQFFNFARDLVWVDGEFAPAEQSVMTQLLQTHLKDMDIDDLVGKVSLEFEDDPHQIASNSNQNNDTRGMLSSFRRRFLSFIGGE